MYTLVGIVKAIEQVVNSQNSRREFQENCSGVVVDPSLALQVPEILSGRVVGALNLVQVASAAIAVKAGTTVRQRIQIRSGRVPGREKVRTSGNLCILHSVRLTATSQVPNFPFKTCTKT